jgi:eukaryotic-like serine/threonine-protein kinase
MTGNDRSVLRAAGGASGPGIIGRLSTPRKVEVFGSPDRLESWKEIAAYLNRSERTVRRWEEREGLPVHRLQHDKRGSVYAYARELDAWRESRRQLIDAEPPETPAAGLSMRRRWSWVAAGSALVVAASAGVYWMLARPSPPPAARTPNPEAVRLAQLANFGINAGRVQIQTGIRYYQDAIRIDPEYVPAWVGLATGHLAIVWFAEVPPSESMKQARMEALQAVRLDPSSGPAVRVLAAVSHYFDWDHVNAEAQYRKAIELLPRGTVSLSWFADFLTDMRRFDEARVYYTRAHDLGPRWLEPIVFAGNTHFFSGNPDLAIVEYQRVLESEPNFGFGNHFLGRAYMAKGRYEEGLDRLRKSNELLGDGPFSRADLGYALALAGKRDEAEAILSDMMKRRERAYYPAFSIAVVHLGLGNTEAALDWLERAADERCLGFYMPSVDPTYDSVRAHPRFKAVMQRANLPQ